MYSHIFLDMDGVLADFVGGVTSIYGTSFRELLPKWPVECWDIPSVLGIEDSAMWTEIDKDPDYWSDLAGYPWKQELIELARQNVASSGDLKLLTSPSLHWHCHAGKRRWADHHAPGLELILCASKHLIARHDRLLIDDSDRNVDKWREAGGEAILFPAHWNSNHEFADDPMAHVRDMLTTLSLVV